MGGVYPRKNKLWIWFKDNNGKRQFASTKYRLEDEDKARKVLKAVERRLAAEKELGVSSSAPLTLKFYGDSWLKERKRRGLAVADQDKGRLIRHVFPTLGHVLLKDLRPKDVRDLIRKLQYKKSERGGFLAPRTVRHVYGTLHTMLHDAVVDELISSNPCVLKRGELPGKIDKDPAWRSGAVFTRREVESFISSELIPEDRRTLNAILFLSGLRFGEAAALRWRDYDTVPEPLGRLLVSRSYDFRTKKEKGVVAHIF